MTIGVLSSAMAARTISQARAVERAGADFETMQRLNRPFVVGGGGSMRPISAAVVHRLERAARAFEPHPALAAPLVTGA